MKEEEPVETALSFFEEMPAFSRREWPAEVQETRFVPGEMKTAETEENCWFIVLRNEMQLYAVIHNVNITYGNTSYSGFCLITQEILRSNLKSVFKCRHRPYRKTQK